MPAELAFTPSYCQLCGRDFLRPVGTAIKYCRRCAQVDARQREQRAHSTSLEGRIETVRQWLLWREPRSLNPGDSPLEIIQRFDAEHQAKAERRKQRQMESK